MQNALTPKPGGTANRPFGTGVRSAWQVVLQSGNSINLQTKVDNKFLYQYLGALEAKYDKKELSKEAVYTRPKTSF